MTAALCAAINILGKAGLEGTPGLFAALLSGVSIRLDSPQLPIRSPLYLTAHKTSTCHMCIPTIHLVFETCR